MEEKENDVTLPQSQNSGSQQNLNGAENVEQPSSSNEPQGVENSENSLNSANKNLGSEQISANVESSEKELTTEENSNNLQVAQSGEKLEKTEPEKAEKADKQEQKEKILSADELYAKTETEKLLKKKKTKRFATLAGLALAFCLAIVVIVLAVVPVSLAPKCLRGGFDKVEYYGGTSTSSRVKAFYEDDAAYAQVMKAYKKSFSQAYLSALFSGSLSSYSISEVLNDSRTRYTSKNQVLGLLDSGDYCLYLHFGQTQTLTQKNGKVYGSRYSGGTSAWPDGKIVFDEAFVEVNKSAGLVGTRIFVVGQYPEIVNKEPTGKYDKYIITITVRADTSALYGIWDSLPLV